MNRIAKPMFLVFLVFLFNCAHITSQATAISATITVNFNNEQGLVNKKVFGDNHQGYDPSTFESWQGASEYTGYKDFGAGIWNPGYTGVKGTVKEVIGLAKGAGSTNFRFPGGNGANYYDWHQAIGAGRTHFLYGIDEFMQSCSDAGVEAVYTLAYFQGTYTNCTILPASESADLVEYLNSPNISSGWGKVRADNGHPAPYGVKYFEVGNEMQWKQITPQDYANQYLLHYNAIKAVDPSVQVGICLDLWDGNSWNTIVMGIVKGKLDFAILHSYPPSDPVGAGTDPANLVFLKALASPIIEDEVDYKKIQPFLQASAGRIIPLAITECNASFFNNETYLFSLGTALINAEMLRILMKPSNNILLSNNYAFCEDSFGMIRPPTKNEYISHDYSKPITWIKRPNYLVRDLYHNHFGDKLLESYVVCDTYTVTIGGWTPPPQPYLTVNASKSSDGSKLYLMVVNKNMTSSITAEIALSNFVPASSQNAYVLTGSSVDATNENNNNPANVSIKQEAFTINSYPFYFTFKPCSVTAIEITNVLRRTLGRAKPKEMLAYCLSVRRAGRLTLVLSLVQ